MLTSLATLVGTDKLALVTHSRAPAGGLSAITIC
jgi:hypothetical protein